MIKPQLSSEAKSFNPRSREGSDLTPNFQNDKSREFQSTLPRRERRFSRLQIISARCFNPRSREGSDVNDLALPLLVLSFNPRSREGSDQRECQRFPSRNCFNPRSREGSDGTGRDVGSMDCVSIHAPAKGATNDGQSALTSFLVSIHAPAKGATW